jgi:CRP-like cAMP-binding protein
VSVDGRVVAQVGPGAVVGERAWLESGPRTAELRADTDIRVAEFAPAACDPQAMTELAGGHQREVPA